MTLTENSDPNNLFLDSVDIRKNGNADYSDENKPIRQRPHSLNIKTKIIITGTGGYKVCHSSKMVSVDSIGTCSLNLEDERSLTSSLIGDAGSSVSRQAVQSASIDPVISPSPSNNHIVWRDKGSEINGQAPKEKFINIQCESESMKKPSYVGLSCSVSGYSESNRYNSKITDPENNPTHLHLLYSKSRDSSPQRTDSDYYSTHFIGHHVVGGGEGYVNGDERGRTNIQSKFGSSRSVSVDRGQKMYKPERLKKPPSNFNNISHFHSRTRERYMNGYRENLPMPHSGGNELVNGFDCPDDLAYEESLKSGSSFIKQRIEKLYGPGAVVQGFKVSKKVLTREKSSSNELNNDVIDCANQLSDLPVFKHLSPEFKSQISSTREKQANVKYIQVELEDDHPASLAAETSVGKMVEVQLSTNEDNKLSASDVTADKEECTPLCSIQVMSVTNEENDKSQRLSGGADSANLGKPDGASLLNSAEKTVQDEAKRKSLSVHSEDSASSQKQGKHFLEVVNGESTRLQDLINQCDSDLESNSVPEECVGVLLAANGKAGLLLKKKFQQFRGLCEREMNPKEGEAMVTSEDLAGFWDLVCIQINDVDALFERIAQMRSSDWKEVSSPVHVNSGKKVVKKKTNVSRNAGKLVAEKAAANLERKQKLLEAKRRIRDQLQKQESVPSDDVQIFT